MRSYQKSRALASHCCRQEPYFCLRYSLDKHCTAPSTYMSASSHAQLSPIHFHIFNFLHAFSLYPLYLVLYRVPPFFLKNPSPARPAPLHFPFFFFFF